MVKKFSNTGHGKSHKVHYHISDFETDEIWKGYSDDGVTGSD